MNNWKDSCYDTNNLHHPPAPPELPIPGCPVRATRAGMAGPGNLRGGYGCYRVVLEARAPGSGERDKPGPGQGGMGGSDGIQ